MFAEYIQFDSTFFDWNIISVLRSLLWMTCYFPTVILSMSDRDIIHFAAYYRFVVLLFNCLLSFGSYFCFDIPSVLQDQFQGVFTFGRACLGRIRTEWLVILFSSCPKNCFPCLTEPDVPQCNNHQWNSGVCIGTGDEPRGVQFSVCHSFLGVRTCTRILWTR